MPLTGPTPSYDPENPEEAPKAPDEERQHEDECRSRNRRSRPPCCRKRKQALANGGWCGSGTHGQDPRT